MIPYRYIIDHQTDASVLAPLNDPYAEAHEVGKRAPNLELAGKKVCTEWDLNPRTHTSTRMPDRNRTNRVRSVLLESGALDHSAIRARERASREMVMEEGEGVLGTVLG